MRCNEETNTKFTSNITWPLAFSMLCYLLRALSLPLWYSTLHLIVVAASSSGGIEGIVTGWSSIMNFINSVSISTTEEEEVHWETVFFATNECLLVLRLSCLVWGKRIHHILLYWGLLNWLLSLLCVLRETSFPVLRENFFNSSPALQIEKRNLVNGIIIIIFI